MESIAIHNKNKYSRERVSNRELTCIDEIGTVVREYSI